MNTTSVPEVTCNQYPCLVDLTNTKIDGTWTTVSMVMGWVYFAAWSVSFYPQVLSNYRRKSVVGLSFDFTVLNAFGFACYTVFNVAIYAAHIINPNPEAADWREAEKSVKINDVFFAVHALILTLITLAQIRIYETGGQAVSNWTIKFVQVSILVVIVYLVGVFTLQASIPSLSWLNWLYLMSYIKVIISLIKYIPQLVMNYKRKSTKGWSIGNILLDFTGGSLSILQMFIDAAASGNWGLITANPSKVALGLISVAFDVAFIIQHYVLYKDTIRPEYIPIRDEKKPLLP